MTNAAPWTALRVQCIQTFPAHEYAIGCMVGDHFSMLHCPFVHCCRYWCSPILCSLQTARTHTSSMCDRPRLYVLLDMVPIVPSWLPREDCVFLLDAQRGSGGYFHNCNVTHGCCGLVRLNADVKQCSGGALNKDAVLVSPSTCAISEDSLCCLPVPDNFTRKVSVTVFELFA